MADCLNTILQNMLQYFREIAAEILSSLIRRLLFVKQGEPRPTSILQFLLNIASNMLG